MASGGAHRVYQEHHRRRASPSAGGRPGVVAQPLRTLVASLDRDLPVYALTSMEDVLHRSMWPMRVFGGLFVVFGIVAGAASIGLYAVLAFSVSRREREMGIRMALAAAGDVVRLVSRRCHSLAVGVTLGVVLGIAGRSSAVGALRSSADRSGDDRGDRDAGGDGSRRASCRRCERRSRIQCAVCERSGVAVLRRGAYSSG